MSEVSCLVNHVLFIFNKEYFHLLEIDYDLLKAIQGIIFIIKGEKYKRGFNLLSKSLGGDDEFWNLLSAF